MSLPVERGDLFMLASDGVHEHVEPVRLVAIVRSHGDDLDGAARAIVAQALGNGSPDNLSVQLLRLDTLPDHQAGEAHRLRAGLPLPPLLRPREVFDGYRIERELHASHRSHVYLATDLDSGDSVVLKTPSIDLGQDEAYLDRFIMEEWIARRVNSAHVLRPRSRTRARSHLYVAMEYVQGQTLAQWMRDRPAPELETVRDIVEQVARGLQAFHRMEMLHQDLRPENVMVDGSGTVKIIDFGSTHVAGLADGAPSGQPAALGTLSHSAPEYLLGEAGSERSDQFSLGVLTYHMLTGRLPYGTRVAGIRTRTDLKQLVYASAMDERRRIPAWVDGALMRAVHPLPHKRYEALSEFVHDLRHPNRRHLARTRVPLAERHPVRFWQGVALLLVLINIALLGLWLAGPRPQPAAPQALPVSHAIDRSIARHF